MALAAKDIKEVLEKLTHLIGKIIRRHRTWNGLTIKQLGLKAGVTPNYIGEIERGRYDPSIRTLGKIASALDIPLSQLIKEAEEELAKEGE